MSRGIWGNILDSFFFARPSEIVDDLLEQVKIMKKIIAPEKKTTNTVCDLFAIGRRVKNAREAMGLSRQEFAEKIGMHRVSLSRLEAGKLKPSFDTLCAISEVTGKNVGWFFESDEYKKRVEFLEMYFRESKK
jgi:ribosome-binding protein aMBF1 (putative translation factor)